MTRIVTALGLFAALLTVCFLGGWYTEKAISQVDTCLQHALTAAREENWEEALRASKEADALWETAGGRLSLYTAHSKLDAVTQNLVAMREQAKCRAREPFFSEAARCRALLSALVQAERPTPENIF